MHSDESPRQRGDQVGLGNDGEGEHEIRGDVNGYLTLIAHADDYTLMAPFGGAPTRGFDTSSERLAELARFFKGGTSELELVQSSASGGPTDHTRCDDGVVPLICPTCQMVS